MSAPPVVFVALSQFCENDPTPERFLREAGWVVRRNPLGRRLTREEVPHLLQGAQAVLAGVEPYPAETLAQLPNLRCISRCGTGTDSIDLKAAERSGITVLTTPDEVVPAVAELTVAMILALARNFPLHGTDLKAGHWQKRTGRLLSELTIGLIGFGRIGKRVSELLRVFGARLLVTDPQANPSDPVVRVPLHQLLVEADVVSLHASGAPEKGCLLGKQEIASMKPGAMLVNTARGHLVDEPALIEALRQGHLSAAALDVFREEPCSGELMQLPSVLATPHVGSLTVSSRAAMERRCAKNVVDFFSRSREHP